VRDLDAVLERSLARERECRFVSVGELRAALLPALAACPPLPRGAVVVSERRRGGASP
jgi:hypothetical protein